MHTHGQGSADWQIIILWIPPLFVQSMTHLMHSAWNAITSIDDDDDVTYINYKRGKKSIPYRPARKA
jgi:hypothetical protein